VAWCRTLDRFDQVHPTERIALLQATEKEPENDVAIASGGAAS
jgi:hypothetical protein